jgi:molybdopterin-guanine dinucleotide biosynthesis protein A
VEKTSMTKPLLNGLILNGGASTRMGLPKSDIKYHNKPQYEYLFELLSTCCDAVYFSVKQKNNAFPYKQIEDQLLLESPLNGIYSALKFTSSHRWLVVAIDMPMLDKETLEYLINHSAPTKIATCYYDSSGKRPEPLVSLWEPTALPLLKSFIENGGISPRTFLESHVINMLTVKNPDVLLNINAKVELENFMRKNQKS